MRGKLPFILAMTVVCGVQVLSLPSAARVQNLGCANPSATCSRYGTLGFSSYSDCVSFYEDYCEAIASPDGGCYYDPREGETVCL